MKKNFKLTQASCFIICASTAITCILSSLLASHFHNEYGISYTLIGLLVVINFISQISVDLLYSFLSNKLNLKLSVKLTPLIMGIGFLLFAFSPYVFPNHIYLGLALGTIIYSAASGLAEVLISPTVTYLPLPNKEKRLSNLHSFYAWGVVGVAIFSGLFLYFIGQDKWQLLCIILACLPLLSFILIMLSPLPELKEEAKIESKEVFKNKLVYLFIIAMFFNGASEVTMSQWCSAYLEISLGLQKVICDLLGLALFGAFLGIGRVILGRHNDKAYLFVISGSIGAIVCYLLAVFTPLPLIGLFACAFTGFCVASLWPGTLIISNERIPLAGVTIFALMAVGGDMGCAAFPQLTGLITDLVISNDKIVEFGNSINLSPDQIGMKIGLLVGVIAPITATVCFLIAFRSKKKNDKLIKEGDVND